MKGYTDKTSIQNYLLTEIDSSFEDQLNAFIEQAEDIIDQQTDRNFKADSTDSARLYDGDGERDILIDDCQSVSKVRIGTPDGVIESEDEVPGTDYKLYPANEKPKTKIRLLYGRATRGSQNVEVTGKWGYSASVPAAIRFVATVLVAGMIQAAGPKSDSDVQSMTVGRYTVTYKNKDQITDYQRAMDTLETYKKYTF